LRTVSSNQSLLRVTGTEIDALNLFATEHKKGLSALNFQDQIEGFFQQKIPDEEKRRGLVLPGRIE
jgi:hypothetical protein